MTDMDTIREAAKETALEAEKAAEQFRRDLKDFLDQLKDPLSWKDGMKLVMEGGLGFLKDLQEMLYQRDWTPDKLFQHLEQTFGALVIKHPELSQQWEAVQVSFDFAKLKTNQTLDHVKDALEKEFGLEGKEKLTEAIWAGVKAEIKQDLATFFPQSGSQE